ncbi:MAG: mechanosensitive ion channel [Caldilineales bacterium]|nr:mechanosensitive ion channel [Caldilineales bacterium]
MQYDLGLIVTTIINFSLKVIAAFLIFAIGRWLAKRVSGLVRRQLSGRGVDEAVVRMAATLVNIGVLILAVVVALGVLGVQTTVFAALVAALGIAVGLALQGALANFAGGVLILTFRPFRIGDLVEISGTIGIVQDIQIVATVLSAIDGSTVIMPNGQVSGNKIVNYSTSGIRRVDMVFGIGYDDDIQLAKSILTEVISQNALILPEPAPVIRVSELADSSVNFSVLPYAKLEHFWDVKFDTIEQVKKRFDEAGISIPFPQQDVHFISASSAPNNS